MASKSVQVIVNSFDDALIYWRLQVMYYYSLGCPHNLQNWEVQPVKS